MRSSIDKQIVYNQLDQDEASIWNLLLASGYLKVKKAETYGDVDIMMGQRPEYELVLTNFEVRLMFENMMLGWFGSRRYEYNNFVKALLMGDLDAMNGYMNRVSLNCFSNSDTENRLSGIELERFYHGFVLGLLVELEGKYVLTSNRERGFGENDHI